MQKPHTRSRHGRQFQPVFSRPEKLLAIGLAFHEQAADKLGGEHLGGAGEEGLEEVLGGRGGYGSGMGGSGRE